VIALLAIERGIFIAEPLEALEREFIVRTFGFLQAQYVGTNSLEEPRHQIDAQPNRIDVPACNGQLHRDQEFRDQEFRDQEFRDQESDIRESGK
jgi:hypothetical protein